MAILAFEEGTLPQPEPGFVPPFMEREKTFAAEVEAEARRQNAALIPRFSRVWKMRNSSSRLLRFWHRLLFVVGL